ncbi:MAG: ATP-binding protein [Candidatus Scalindua sp.]
MLITAPIHGFNGIFAGVVALQLDMKSTYNFIRDTTGLGNTGSGMKKETTGRIFEPFFTTASSGMGMGLSIVKEIITSNNGNISVESEEGKGSTFKMVFPAARDL